MTCHRERAIIAGSEDHISSERERVSNMEKQAIRRAREFHARREARRRQQWEQLRQEQYRRVCAAIGRLAPAYPAVRAVYLFGSLMQPGRFRPWSDLDVAVCCDDVEEESRFWRALEKALQTDVDLRPCVGAVARAVATHGECVYEREVSAARAQHSKGPGSH